MSLVTLGGLERGAQQKLVCVKGSLVGPQANGISSLWRATSSPSLPAQGAIPGAASICDGTSLTGGFVWDQPSASRRTYVYGMQFSTGFQGGELILVDRLGHMGGLDGTLLTSQAVNLDLNANLASLNLQNRIGRSDYSEVLWEVEVYTAIGSTSANITVGFTYGDGTTDTQVIAFTSALRFAGQCMTIFPNVAGKYIRSVESVILSGTTGTAGSFGVTAFRPLGNHASMAYVTLPSERDWFDNLIRVHDKACLSLLRISADANTDTITGLIRLIQG